MTSCVLASHSSYSKWIKQEQKHCVLFMQAGHGLEYNIMLQLQKCVYHGKLCHIRKRNQDGTIIILNDDYQWSMSDGGWSHIDKFEWEKTVHHSDIGFVEDTEGR